MRAIGVSEPTRYPDNTGVPRVTLGQSGVGIAESLTRAQRRADDKTAINAMSCQGRLAMEGSWSAPPATRWAT